jgi:uncharacterized membrane protein
MSNVAVFFLALSAGVVQSLSIIFEHMGLKKKNMKSIKE